MNKDLKVPKDFKDFKDLKDKLKLERKKLWQNR